MFLVDAIDIQIAKDTLDRKSAPFDWFIDNGVEINDNLDFIKHIK